MRMSLWRGMAVLAWALLAAFSARAQEDLPEITVGTLEFGTVNWELEVIRDGLARANGFVLTPVVVAAKDAAAIAFKQAEVDATETDWLLVARQVADGRHISVLPF